MPDEREHLPAWGRSFSRVMAPATVGLIVLACATAAGLSGHPGVHDVSLPLLVSVVVLAVAGMIVAWARPDNTIGWLLLATAALQAMSVSGQAYGEAAYADPDGPWPGALGAAWLASWAWLPSLTLPVAVLPAIYPSGRPTSRGWKVLVLAGGLGTFLLALRLALAPDDMPSGAHLAFIAPPWFALALTVLGLALVLTAVAVGLTGTVVRAVRSSYPERQQLLWLLVPVVALAVIVFGGFPESVLMACYGLPGVAVAVGVLRYRLLGITVVLRRTFFYLPLTVVVALVVAAVSTLTARVAPEGPLPIIVAAGVVALLVGPVARWLQRTVDRVVLGQRADPMAAVNSVVGRGEGGDDPMGSILTGLAETVGVRYVGVTDRQGVTLADYGDSSSPLERLPLRSAGEDLGNLVISTVPDLAGRRIVAALTPHIASVVRAQALTTEVRAERARVVDSTIAERERIRHDLHDGLGPSLSGISLSLQAADAILDKDGAAARVLLRRARDEADVAVDEVRRVLDGLRPSALDAENLAGALRSAAVSLGFDRDGGPTLVLTSQLTQGLPPMVEEAAYRIATEALHNVARHAGASRCEVNLQCVDLKLEIRICDDGCGLIGATHSGVGLNSMRRRAEDAGGILNFTSPIQPADQGTLVCAVLPLPVAP